MSAAFTPVANWPHLQHLNGGNEILLAFFERMNVLNESTDSFTLLVSGDDAQHRVASPWWEGHWWSAQEYWMETSCLSFIDHVNGPLNPAGDDFLYFTLSSWRAAAGLNANGFRRKVNMEDEFSYGVIQAGDIRGPWCFEDMQKGLSALKWTKHGAGFTKTWHSVFARSYKPTWARVVSEIASNWPHETSVDPNYQIFAGYVGVQNGDGSFNGQAGRQTGIYSFTFPSKVESLSCEVELYLRAVSFKGVFDDNGTGLIEDKWCLVETSSAETSPWTSSSIGGTSLPNPPPEPPYNGGNEVGQGFKIQYSQNSAVIAKWDFTNI
jgi:hypothetical protein